MHPIKKLVCLILLILISPLFFISAIIIGTGGALLTFWDDLKQIKHQNTWIWKKYPRFSYDNFISGLTKLDKSQNPEEKIINKTLTEKIFPEEPIPLLKLIISFLLIIIMFPLRLLICVKESFPILYEDLFCLKESLIKRKNLPSILMETIKKETIK